MKALILQRNFQLIFCKVLQSIILKDELRCLFFFFFLHRIGISNLLIFFLCNKSGSHSQLDLFSENNLSLI